MVEKATIRGQLGDDFYKLDVYDGSPPTGGEAKVLKSVAEAALTGEKNLVGKKLRVLKWKGSEAVKVEAFK